MGLGEFFQQTATTILLFKADTSDAKRGLRELAGEEKKAAEQAIKLAESRNKAMDRLAKGITATTVAMKLGKEIIGGLEGAWKSYEAAAIKAGGADAEKARAFRSALRTFDDSMDKVKQSIGGIVASLAPLVELAGTIIGYAADAIGVVGSIVGGVANAFTHDSGLGSAFAGTELEKNYKKTMAGKAEAYIADPARAQRLIQITQALAASGLISASAIQTQRYAKGVAGNVSLDPAQATLLDALGLASPLVGGAFRGTGQSSFKGVLKGMKAPNRGGGGGDNAITWEQYFANTGGSYEGIGGALGGAGTDYGMGAGAVQQTHESKVQDILNNVEALNIERDRLGREKKRSTLDSIFGEPKEFDLYAAKFQMLADSVSIFSGALQQGFDAWVSGSVSAKEALAGVFQATISGLASTMFAHALEEGALAVGALARGIGGNPQGFAEAAAHGKAAAGYAAAGIGIGAIARGLGGGGGAGGGGSGGGGYSGPPSGYSSGDHRSGGGEQTVIYVGEGWEESPGQRRSRTARNYRMARRELAGAEGVRDI